MTRVIFRKYKDGDIIALFPKRGDYMCESYMHIGQHSMADYPQVIKTTKPANESEYKELYDELVSIGYDDLVVKKKV